MGLPTDSLTKLAFEQGHDQHVSNCGARPPIPYRERHRANTKSLYALPESELNASFQAEWIAFFEYKTSHWTCLKRSTKGTWRLVPPVQIGGKLPTLAYLHGRGAATASMTLNKLRAFFGFLALSEKGGGRGIPSDDAQSLAWLAVPEAVNGYLEFKTARSEGLVHKGQAGFAELAAGMTHPLTGFLTQQPHFSQRLPEAVSGRDWRGMCEETHKLCTQWKRAAVNISRDPKEAIQGLLSLSEPLAPVFRAIEALDRAAADAPTGSLKEARYKRDALLLSMLLANPLRVRNYTIMQYHVDGRGHLYVRQDGQWRLRFAPSEFKNEIGAARTPYDAPLPISLSDRIVDYLYEYRPRLVQKHPNAPWVFPSSSSAKPWSNLSKQVFRLTKRYLPETLGFGEHSFRHLVATDYLRKNPKEYLTVAQLLHDTIETVLREYAHLNHDDAFGKYELHLRAIPR
ncbi:hypothetical protein [Cupriavidus oxalaticus]|uniref:hypothetical protein n=1 Tax=Cupriavidus oxalaticus TaxID=96344 RepID=UPI003F737C7C